MHLLTLEEVSNLTKQKWESINKHDPEIGLEMQDLVLNNGETRKIKLLEKSIEIKKIPIDFINTISNYSFDYFSILNIQFGFNNQYIDTIIKITKENNFFEENMLLVALGDPFSILMDINNGNIFAIDKEEKIFISNSFSEFIRYLGTYSKSFDENNLVDIDLFIKNKYGINSLKFWHELLPK